MAGITGIEMIIKERLRQLQEEGWTPEHDDTWREGELANSAAAYAMTYEMRDYLGHHNLETIFSFRSEWWKPARNDSYDERKKELAKAGALIAAEIDRLNRLESEMK